jgi:transposase
MARPRLPIVLHLSPDEIARRYRTCRTGVEKTHWQILWLLTRTAEPPTPAQVASQVGLTPAWVRTVLKRWNAQGPEGLADRRPLTNGGQSKLTAPQQAALFNALQGRPADGGLWSGPKVVAYVRDHFGLTVRPETGWRWLTRLGLSLQVPRPKNPGAASPEEQQVWKRRPGRPPGRAAPRSPREGRRAVGRG